MSGLKEKYIVGTRESQLARLQTDIAIGAIAARHPEIKLEIVTIKTLGDKVLGKPIAELEGRGVFVKELEEALIRQEVDFVVHSLKDLPTDMSAGLTLRAVLGREDARDVLVAKHNMTLSKLPPAATIASSSRRRAAQLLALRSDLRFVDVRGNIPTRLRKLDEGIADAMVLAAAGLIRLGQPERIAEYFPFGTVTPAVGQGVLALECRADDGYTCQLLDSMNDAALAPLAACERAFLNRIGGGCSVPVGAIAEASAHQKIKLQACIASLDGLSLMRMQAEGSMAEPETLGQQLADSMLAAGGQRILQSLRESAPLAVPPP
jgi:hydroxymethylbilane synthase